MEKELSGLPKTREQLNVQLAVLGDLARSPLHGFSETERNALKTALHLLNAAKSAARKLNAEIFRTTVSPRVEYDELLEAFCVTPIGSPRPEPTLLPLKDHCVICENEGPHSEDRPHVLEGQE